MERTDIDTSQIVVFGRSLGGAVGAVLTKNNPEKVFVNFSSLICCESVDNVLRVLSATLLLL